MGRQSRHCTRCIVTTDEQDIPATGHQMTGWVVTTAPTVMKEGVQTRVCNYCEHQENKKVARLVLTAEMAESYGLVHFTVVHAQTMEPIEGASISIETPEGEVTIFSDEDGKASHILPTGKHPVFIKAPGCKPRSLKITVKGGEQELPQIGVSERDPVEVELKHHYMTYDEILAAGIDPNAEGNSHVYRYELTITYRPELDLISLSYMFNADGDLLRFPDIQFPDRDGEGGSWTPGTPFYIGEPDRSPREYPNGKGFSFWYTLFDGTEAQIHVYEKFLLIIYGEVKWLKEMFDVEMVILNTTGTDSIENAEAELILPEGLSLATMRADLEQQTLRQKVPTIPAGGTHTVHWYVRGDAEGSYDIAATLDGMLMPFEEEFHYYYEAEEPIKVYAGSAFLLTLEVPTVVYYGTNADIRITLTNVSDRTMYNVSHTINNTVQKRLTYTTEDGKTTVDEEILGSSGGSQKLVVTEFHPGDQLIIEASIEICFEAEVLKNRVKDLLDEMKSLCDSISAMTNIFDAFDTASDIAGDLTDFMDNASKAVDAGKMSVDAIKAADSFNSLTDYMDFSKGEVENRDSTPDFFGMLSDLVDSLPIRYVLESVSVETQEDSTAEIPWKIVRVPGPEVNPLIPAGSISMPKLLYSIAILLIDRQDVKIGGMTLVKDYTNTEGALEYVKYCWEQTAAIRAADPSGNATFHTYYVPAGSSISLMDADAPEDVTITVDNKTAKWENGVLTFTGEGMIEVTPHTKEGGTLYVQVDDQEPKAYVIEVVEPHECASDEWVIEVPATEKTDGFRTKHCDVCDEIFEVESLTSCGDHTFGDWQREVAPNVQSLGIDTRFCTKCCVMEYRLTDMSFIEECIDEDRDHVCDYGCGETVGIHAAADGSHSCGYCGQQMSTCEDEDNDNVCDICDGNMGKTYTVTFDINGGAAEPEAQVIDHGAYVAQPADPIRENHAFIGWTTDFEGENKWNFDTDTVTRDITLYAQWKQHQWGAEEYVWRKNGCVAVQRCGQCDALLETEVSFELTAEELRMSHVPDDLQLLIAGYTLDGKLIGCQLEDAAEIVAISIPDNAEAAAQIYVFFVNTDWEPLRSPMK